MKKIIFSAMLVIFAATLPGCGASNKAEVDACVLRGVAYFKDIGSYPTLHSGSNRGRSTKAVSRERCKRTTTAF